jgi:hypothetical protein
MLETRLLWAWGMDARDVMGHASDALGVLLGCESIVLREGKRVCV